jgi:nucleotide-binding universal stress UspA family protein
MRILICSDGMPAADNATRVGGLVAAACRAETTLLGIVEETLEEPSLRAALETQAHSLRDKSVTTEIVLRAGEPIRQILAQTSRASYDLVVIGARRTGESGLYRRSLKTYEVIKSISPPVLVAQGERAQLKKFLVCTGGKEFIEGALQITGQIAAATGASVTLLHVMAEPPAIYTDLVRLEEDVDLLFQSNSELAENLRRQTRELESLGVPVQVRIKHGMVLDQVFAEVRAGDHDLIVTGTSQARGIVRHYIMGDLTRSILNQADCPVLVARAAPASEVRTLRSTVKGWFRSKRQ